MNEHRYLNTKGHAVGMFGLLDCRYSVLWYDWLQIASTLHDDQDRARKSYRIDGFHSFYHQTLRFVHVSK